MAGPTNFLESNALLAVMSGDEAEARRIAEGCFPGELRHLEEAAAKLSGLCAEVRLVREHDAGKHAGMVNGRGIDIATADCPRCQDESGWTERKAQEAALDALLRRGAE